MLDPYVYPGTDVLKNVLNIKDKEMLDGAEANYVSLRLRELAKTPLAGDYDFSHFSNMQKMKRNLCSALIIDVCPHIQETIAQISLEFSFPLTVSRKILPPFSLTLLS